MCVVPCLKQSQQDNSEGGSETNLNRNLTDMAQYIITYSYISYLDNYSHSTVA